jgi:hypothetical protein
MDVSNLFESIAVRYYQAHTGTDTSRFINHISSVLGWPLLVLVAEDDQRFWSHDMSNRSRHFTFWDGTLVLSSLTMLRYVSDFHYGVGELIKGTDEQSRP